MGGQVEGPAKETPPSQLTPLFLASTIVLTAIFAATSVLIVAFLPEFIHFFSWGNNWWGVAPGPLLVITLALLIGVTAPRLKLDPKKLNIIWAVGAMAVMVSSFRTPYEAMLPALAFKTQEPYAAQVGRFVPGLWAPETTDIMPVLEGGVPIRWDLWGPIMGWWIAYFLTIYFLMLGLGVMIRRQVIEVERATFPVGSAATEIMNAVVPVAIGGTEPKPRYTRRRMVFVGILVGVLLAIPWALRLIFPWFPSVYGWGQAPFVGHLGLLDLEQAIPALHYALPMASLYTRGDFLTIGLLLFVPTDIQLSAGLSWILFLVVIPVMAANAGLLPSPGPWSSGSRYWLMREPPMNWYTFADVGMMLYGLALWPLIFGWKHLRDVGRSVLRPKPGEAEAEGMTYRIAFIIFIVAIIIRMALWGMVGVTEVPSLLFLTWFMILAQLAVMRMHGEGINQSDGIQWASPGQVYWTLFPGYTNDTMTRNNIMTQWIAFHTGQPGLNYALGTSSYMFDTYKMQASSKTSLRQIIAAQSLGIIVAALVAVPLLITLGHTFGVLKLPGLRNGFWWEWGDMDSLVPGGAMTYPGYSVFTLLGFLIIGGCWAARMVLPWFPLHPIGIAVGATTSQAYQGFGAGMLIAWVIKMVILRFGGAKSLDGYVFPFVGGMLGGWMVTSIIGTIALTSKFFFPW